MSSPGVVLILDDDKLVRFHLERVLQSEGFATQCFSSGEEFLALPLPTQPACLLLDVNLTGNLDGPAIQDRMKNMGLPIPIIFITAHATVPMAVKALKLGALDVLTKPVDQETLVTTVAKALATARDLRSELLSQKEGKSLLLLLTNREREVISWIIAGKLNKQIASALGITERTVKAHRANVMEKLEISSVAELVRLADLMGIQTAKEA